MNRLVLIEPTIEDKERLLDYKNEFIASGDIMHGTSGLMDKASYEVWFEELMQNTKESTLMEGFVPATTYLVKTSNNGRLIGVVNIRHRLNEFLLNYGGHIGYSVRKSERQKGYATEMLAMALIKCRTLGLSKVLITCDKDNIASAKTISNNGGVLENEVSQERKITQRYWIEL